MDDCVYYMKSSDPQIATKALMALCFMVTEDKAILETNDKNLKFICDELLGGAIKPGLYSQEFSLLFHRKNHCTFSSDQISDQVQFSYGHTSKQCMTIAMRRGMN